MTSVLDLGAEMVTMQCDIQCNIIAMQIVLQNCNVISIAILSLADTSISDHWCILLQSQECYNAV